MVEEQICQPLKKQKFCRSTDDLKGLSINMNEETFTYQWTINNFTHLPHNNKVSQVIMSPTFSALNDNKCNWRLILYPRGICDFNKDYVVVYLVYVYAVGELKKEIEFAEIQFSIFDMRIYAEVCQRIVSNETLEVGQSIGVSLIKTKYTMDLEYGFPPRVYPLKILCKITRKTGIYDQRVDLFHTMYRLPTTYKLSDKFKHLLSGTDAQFDIKLISQNQEFLLHRAVLIGRSLGFRIFLIQRLKYDIDILRGITGYNGETIDLSHFITPEVLHEMLHFIYTDEAPRIEEMPEELLALAENYGFEDLKYKCELVLIRKLTFNNVIDTLVLARRCNAKLLRNLAFIFTIRFMPEVGNTAQFKAYCRARGCRFIKDLFWLLA